jgi:hypothetical protein
MIDRRERRGRSLPRRLTAGLCAVGLATQMACYTLQPLQEVVPVSGQMVAIELSDRGRVLVGGQLGEQVDQVMGTIISSTDSAVTLSVARTVLMQGSTVVWTGEQVAIPREGVRGYRIREFAKGKTVMLSVGVAVGLVLIGVGLSIIGGGNGRTIDPGGCTSDCNPTLRVGPEPLIP